MDSRPWLSTAVLQWTYGLGLPCLKDVWTPFLSLDTLYIHPSPPPSSARLLSIYSGINPDVFICIFWNTLSCSTSPGL
eukprot:904449-Prorocentrum_lima.AAC.1